MADLWSLSIALRIPGASLKLTYSSGDAAHAAYHALAIPRLSAEESERGLPEPIYDPEVEISDTFGSTVTVDRTQIALRWVTNLGEECEGNGQVQLLQARANAKLQRTAQSDLGIRGPLAMPIMGKPS
jgi:hypothetical protein